MAVVRLGPHERMTPTEALAEAAGRDWEDVVICGYVRDDDSFRVMSSKMDRATSLWIAEWLREYAMGNL